MDMKKARDQARKESKANKKNTKGKAKAVKDVAVSESNPMTSVHDAFGKKTSDSKIVVAQPAKTDAKRDMKKRG